MISQVKGLLLYRLFQFPFPRDSPCDAMLKEMIKSTTGTFSSLFLGIALAIEAQIVQQSQIYVTFSSLFLGIALAIQT